jgi:hypothetical protein
MVMPKDPEKRNKALCHYREAAQKRYLDSEYKNKNKAAREKMYRDPEWNRKNKEGAQKRSLDLELGRKQKENAQRRAQDPEYRRKHKEVMQKLNQDPEYRRKQREGVKKKFQDPEHRRKNKEGAQKRAQDPECRRKQRESAQKLAKDPLWQLNHMEAAVGGFCIQNITYRDPPPYCELWCPNLWRRIDAAQNYQSILSGKTKEDNIGRDGKPRALSRHHVYWQPKACCEWDEDAQGYYAWIEIGTKKHSNKVKYYIKGDPNKFVLITAEEHGIIKKNKLQWIKVFEDLIETKLGGICYFSKVGV